MVRGQRAGLETAGDGASTVVYPDGWGDADTTKLFNRGVAYRVARYKVVETQFETSSPPAKIRIVAYGRDGAEVLRHEVTVPSP